MYFRFVSKLLKSCLLVLSRRHYDSSIKGVQTPQHPLHKQTRLQHSTLRNFSTSYFRPPDSTVDIVLTISFRFYQKRMKGKEN